MNIMDEQLCSGESQFHTDKKRPLNSISLSEIVAMTMNPNRVDKQEGKWAIFSDLQTRTHIEQLKYGSFHALWIDVDETTLSLKEICAILAVIIEQSNFIAYTTRSATEDKQKCRIIIPLAQLCTGHEFVSLQKILNDKLEKAGITPDRATQRVGQICFLPNLGDYYDYIVVNDSGDFNWKKWEPELKSESQAKKENEKQRIEQHNISLEKAKQRVLNGSESPIEAFNAEFSIESQVIKYNYVEIGNRFIPPNSSSGNAGATIKGNLLISHHSSDAGLGRSFDGGTYADSFDMYVHYEHEGNFNAALKAFGDLCGINKANQKAYMEAQSVENRVPENQRGILPLQTDEPKEPFSFDKFSLNGQSEAMEKQMLDDCFILGELAILGQATVFYAKPNSGKTLLTLWLLVDAIKKSQINAKDVYYINADDNYKGLVTKLKIAEKYGFNMLAPGHEKFKAEDFEDMLRQLSEDNNAKGVIIILDTQKKFTEIMDKRISAKFGKSIREFVSKGGSIILLAHTNKHRGADGKLIAAGTSDTTDDADCAYMIDTIIDGNTTRATFENNKLRGYVVDKVTYEYMNTEGGDYQDLLDSVKLVPDGETEKFEKDNARKKKLNKDKLVIQTIKEVISDGINKKTELVKEVKERCDATKIHILAVLNDYEGDKIFAGHQWTMEKTGKNTITYKELGLPESWGTSASKPNKKYKSGEIISSDSN